MDGGAAGMGGIEIDKRTGTNVHARHQRIQMVLALRDYDEMFDEDGKPTDEDVSELSLRKRRDTKASTIIGLTLGSEQLEQVSECQTTEEMWSTLQGVFQQECDEQDECATRGLNRRDERRRGHAGQY